MEATCNDFGSRQRHLVGQDAICLPQQAQTPQRVIEPKDVAMEYRSQAA